MSALNDNTIAPPTPPKEDEETKGRALIQPEGELRPVRSTGVRFALLAAAAGFMFGNYYFFDQTSATEKKIIAHTGMSEPTFGLLSSVYSWPNVVLPLFGGLFIDRMGVRVAILFFTSLVLVGSCLFTLGLWTDSVALLVVARVIFGMGGESQNVGSLTLISKWFAGRELAFAMAINVSVSRLGSVAVLDSQPVLVSSLGITPASVVTSVICVVSLCSCILATMIDRRAEKKDAERGLSLATGDSDAAASLKDLSKLSKLYWLVSLSCVSVYVAVFPFIQVVSAPYLKDRFDFGDTAADTIASAINLTSAVLSPILGLCVDRWGRRPMLLVTSAVCLCCCHIGFLLFPQCYHCATVIVLYVLMGAGVSVYGSVIWPCIPLVVDQEVVGTAFGITTSLQNFGMAVSPMILTALHSATDAWTVPFLYIVACCAVGSIAGVVIWILDARGSKSLAVGSSS